MNFWREESEDGFFRALTEPGLDVVAVRSSVDPFGIAFLKSKLEQLLVLVVLEVSATALLAVIVAEDNEDVLTLGGLPALEHHAITFPRHPVLNPVLDFEQLGLTLSFRHGQVDLDNQIDEVPDIEGAEEVQVLRVIVLEEIRPSLGLIEHAVDSIGPAGTQDASALPHIVNRPADEHAARREQILENLLGFSSHSGGEVSCHVGGHVQVEFGRSIRHPIAVMIHDIDGPHTDLLHEGVGIEIEDLAPRNLVSGRGGRNVGAAGNDDLRSHGRGEEGRKRCDSRTQGNGM